MCLLVVRVNKALLLLLNSEGEETDDEYKSDALTLTEDDSNDVVLAFITSDEEYMQMSGHLQHAQDEQ